ncbi:MAG: GNAT family N-acetyltransferase [Asgard group archaeon]|nr:GNAT family N-acetyltransferase [Asgard group archaeon]
MQVIKASKEHFNEILDVINISNRESFGKVIPPEDFEDPCLTQESFKEIFERIDFIVYMENNRVIATAGLEIIDNNQAWMRWVYVLPEHQGKGIGKELVQRIELDTQMKGYEQISLFTFERQFGQ